LCYNIIMANKKPKNHENQLSFDDMSGSYHDYSQEKAGEYPYVIANDHKEPQTPLNEIIDEVDEPFTPADLVDAHWKL
ncbi:hypothetical protein GN156_38325, partial [bacterium LRH843]|nr:hypothetical protein [bacterium LRH843]